MTAQTNGRLAPLPGGIRPYESLWSIMQRIIWLNQPTLAELNVFLKFNIKKIDLTTGSASLDYIATELPKHQRWYTHLGLTPRQFSNAIIPPFMGTSCCFKYCLECARLGYHSTVFLLPATSICPAHKTPLRSECPSCGKYIGSHLDKDVLKAPYGCRHCGYILVESNRAFFEAKLPTGFERIKSAGQWIEALKAKTLAWGDLPCSQWMSRDYRGIDPMHLVAALARSCQLPIPRCFHFPFDDLLLNSSHTTPSNALSCKTKVYDPDEPDKFVALYKAFLKKHSSRCIYIKQTGETKKLLKLSDKQALKNYQELAKSTHAILFLRSYCEAWKYDHHFESLYKSVAYQRTRYGHDGNDHSVKSFGGISLVSQNGTCILSHKVSPALANWAESHIFMKELSGLYREAEEYAAEMVRRGRYWSVPYITGRYIPQFFVIIFDSASNTYKFDFWSNIKTSPEGDFAGDLYDSLEERERMKFEMTEKAFKHLVLPENYDGI